MTRTHTKKCFELCSSCILCNKIMVSKSLEGNSIVAHSLHKHFFSWRGAIPKYSISISIIYGSKLFEKFGFSKSLPLKSNVFDYQPKICLWPLRLGFQNTAVNNLVSQVIFFFLARKQKCFSSMICYLQILGIALIAPSVMYKMNLITPKF